MNKLLAIVTLCAFCATAQAVSIQIDDDYTGAHKRKDRINRAAWFEIDNMLVTLDGTLLTVEVRTNFGADNGLGRFKRRTQSGHGIGYGDLFLSIDGWNPHGPAPHQRDNHLRGESWEYGIALDDRWDLDGDGESTASLYQLSGDNSDLVLSQDFVESRRHHRRNQEVAVDTALATLSQVVSNVQFTDTGLVFELDIAGTLLANASEIGLHWTMTGGNDVIEGLAPVPEPETYLMMAIGLASLFAARHRRQKVHAR
ncbi:MAG: PEP-CTERM sorting domain-containing protein [Pseudomonadota bacterium]